MNNWPWNSVKEKGNPTKSGEYIISYTWCAYGKRYEEVIIDYFDEDDEEWSVEDSHYTVQVIAWMDAPEFYRGE